MSYILEFVCLSIFDILIKISSVLDWLSRLLKMCFSVFTFFFFQCLWWVPFYDCDIFWVSLLFLKISSSS